MTRFPTTKTLRQIPGVDGPKALRLRMIGKATREGLRKLWEDAYGESPSGDTVDVRMALLNRELGTHGVEVMVEKGWDGSESPAMYYCNAGDAYVATIIRWRGTYMVTSWGDIVEKYDNLTTP